MLLARSHVAAMQPCYCYVDMLLARRHVAMLLTRSHVAAMQPCCYYVDRLLLCSHVAAM